MLSKGETSRLRALHQRKGREQAGEFLVEGVRLVEDLLASPTVLRKALISPSLEDTARGAELAHRLREAAVGVDVTEQDLARVATTESTQGVVAVAAIPAFELRDVPLDARSLVIVLDAVQDPGNFGTIVRSADAFSATLVAALPGSVDPWNPKSVRSAAGSSLRVPIVETNLDALMEYLRAHDCTLLGAAAEGEDVEGIARGGPMALVLGNEGAGLGTAVRAECHGLVSVRIRGSADSLNVGVAAGILMYLLSRTMWT